MCESVFVSVCTRLCVCMCMKGGATLQWEVVSQQHEIMRFNMRWCNINTIPDHSGYMAEANSI